MEKKNYLMSYQLENTQKRRRKESFKGISKNRVSHRRSSKQLYLSHFTFDSANPVSIGIVGIVFHLLTQHPRKLIVHGVGLSRVNRTAVCSHKPLMNLLQKRKRNTP